MIFRKTHLPTYMCLVIFVWHPLGEASVAVNGSSQDVQHLCDSLRWRPLGARAID